MSRDTDIAWLAGLIDGEGCLQFHKSVNPRKPSRPMYSARMFISMYDRGAIERAAAIIGTTIRTVNSVSTRGLNRYEVGVWGEQLENLLRELLPHLTTKHQQALLLLEARAQCPPSSKVGFRRGENRLTDEDLALREGFYHCLKEAKAIPSTAPVRDGVLVPA